jgi:hypothetical protein
MLLCKCVDESLLRECIACFENMFTSSCGIVISPIAKKMKKTPPCSFSDYKEQEERLESELPIFWDDSRSNKTKVGDLFVFRFDSKHVVFHVVEDVSDSSNRLESWSKNVGQTNRNVLKLSKKSVVVSWDEWNSFNYYGGRQGTTYVDGLKNRTLKSKILTFANEKFNF